MPTIRQLANEVNAASVVVDGCNCQICREQRTEAILDKYCKTLYPELRFKPSGLRFFIKTDAFSVLHYYSKLKKRADDFRKDNEGKRFTFCRFCGVLHLISSTKRIKGKRYCFKCAQDLFICEDCGEIKHGSFARGVRGGRSICFDCYKRNYERCGQCSDAVPKDTILRLPYRRNNQGNISYATFCKPCADGGVVECSECKEITHQAIARSNAKSWLCNACSEMYKGYERNHQFKPLRFNWQRDPMEGKVSEKEFHMGFELEIAAENSFLGPDTLAHLLKEMIGREYFYCMHDGTIERSTGLQGMEICAHPFTWLEYKKIGVNRWDDMLMYLRNKGWKSNLNGIGIHIHTTKAAWGTHQIYKLLKFIYENQSFVITIAQREPNDYCVMDERDFNEAVLVAKDKKNRQQQHYNAINLNSGDNRGASSTTIEFRMFQGTLEPIYFHKNIEFVMACYEFTKLFKVSDMTKDSFVHYVRSWKRMYPCLNEFFNMKGI